MSDSIIDAIYKRNKEITSFLSNAREVTFESDVRDTFRKFLVLSIASYFEKEIKDIIFDFVKRKSQSELIPNFVQHKAIERQYHTFFQWDGNNANAFFGLFGQDFKEKCKEITSSDAELETAVKSFLELGRTRNELVHFDFSTYQLSKNDEEYYALYHSADRFVKFLREQLK